MKLHTYPIENRQSLTQASDLAKPVPPLHGFLEALPNAYGVLDLQRAIRMLQLAREGECPIVLGMGAHPIKLGLTPVLAQLMDLEYIDHLCLNGAGLIHDVELTLYGHTSEDVAISMREGRFGMCPEAAKFIYEAIWEYPTLGLGEAVAQALWRATTPEQKEHSLLCSAFREGVSLSVFPAMGTDTIHMHGDAADWGQLAAQSQLNFEALVKTMQRSEGTGMLWNLGSAVIMPEVFLKAAAVCRNQDPSWGPMTALDCDTQQNYRSATRLSLPGTFEPAIHLTGRHELLLPLLTGLLLAQEAPDATPETETQAEA